MPQQGHGTQGNWEIHCVCRSARILLWICSGGSDIARSATGVEMHNNGLRKRDL